MMIAKKQMDVLRRAVDYYGHECQRRLFAGEIGELLESFEEFSIDAVPSETADVVIMAAQVCIMEGIPFGYIPDNDRIFSRQHAVLIQEGRSAQGRSYDRRHLYRLIGRCRHLLGEERLKAEIRRKIKRLERGLDGCDQLNGAARAGRDLRAKWVSIATDDADKIVKDIKHERSPAGKDEFFVEITQEPSGTGSVIFAGKGKVKKINVIYGVEREREADAEPAEAPKAASPEPCETGGTIPSGIDWEKVWDTWHELIAEHHKKKTCRKQGVHITLEAEQLIKSVKAAYHSTLGLQAIHEYNGLLLDCRIHSWPGEGGEQ